MIVAERKPMAEILEMVKESKENKKQAFMDLLQRAKSFQDKVEQIKSN